MDKQNVAVWISIGLHVITILGGLCVFLLALPTKDYIKYNLDARIKPIETKMESIEADIKEIKEDIDKLEQMHMPSGASFERRTQPPSR